jgi:hypothetical protein
MNLMLPFTFAPSAAVQQAIDALATSGDAEARGAVSTKPEIVTGILDLCGYLEEDDLTTKRLLDPAVGHGAFFLTAVSRLLASVRRHHGPLSASATHLAHCLRGVELHHQTYEATRAALIDTLTSEGVAPHAAVALAQSWLTQGDFLLTPMDVQFDIVVGNPPYVRQERIPVALLDEYKARFHTLYDRADLYVLFYERCLDLLSAAGVLGFICANRWLKNKYGGPLREKIARGFHLDTYINMERLDAFDAQVDAYPAITIIRRTPSDTTRVLTKEHSVDLALPTIFELLRSSTAAPPVTSLRHVSAGSDPLLLDDPAILQLVRQLEQAHPTLEDAGASIGIGVATGADKVYIGQHDALPVEPARLLPLAMASDVRGASLHWSGHGLVNPWEPDGSLAPLEDYPRFAAYMLQHQEVLRARHTAKKSPHAWYKTIDRVTTALTTTPKLLIPDIKGHAAVAFDEGRCYPHHNLYVITSALWDLQALQALLRSSVGLMFVAAYSVRMAGGALRFQAQYLRRIRVPHWDTLPRPLRAQLIQRATSDDQDMLDEAAAAAFALTDAQLQQIQRFADAARTTGRRP